MRREPFSTLDNLIQLGPFEGRFAAVSTALDGFHVGSFEGPKKASTLLAAARPTLQMEMKQKDVYRCS